PRSRVNRDPATRLRPVPARVRRPRPAAACPRPAGRRGRVGTEAASAGRGSRRRPGTRRTRSSIDEHRGRTRAADRTHPCGRPRGVRGGGRFAAGRPGWPPPRRGVGGGDAREKKGGGRGGTLPAWVVRGDAVATGRGRGAGGDRPPRRRAARTSRAVRLA